MKLLRAPAYAWRRGREFTYYLRGRRILSRYSAHYRRAQRVFRANADGNVPGVIDEVGVEVIRPGVPGARIALPAAFPVMVERVARQVGEAMAVAANCRFVPALHSQPVPERTDAVPEVIDGRVLTIQLRDPLAIEGLQGLCEPLMDELERTLYGCFVIADKVYVYRSPVSRQPRSASWTWHFDNHPREVLKVLVYLTDVDEGRAPFEYLAAPRTGAAVPGGPLTPLFGDGRVAPDEIDRLQGDGCQAIRVTGPRGTVIVFDNNVIHRATPAASGPRDVLVLQVRPSTMKLTPRIDPRWTGSFTHWDINRDPADLAAHRNPNRH